MAEKSPDAYRTISEAGEEAGLPAHVLRFWESKFAQLKPVKRAGGRRLYRPQDVTLLKGLRRLLYEEGYTIKGAQKYLKDHGVAHVSALGDGEAPPDTPAGAPHDVPATPAAADDAAAPAPQPTAVAAGAGPGVPPDAIERVRAAHDRLRAAREALQAVL
ncbi:MAG: MerR family transcriptional regulator [Oceanicaulis sp.]